MVDLILVGAIIVNFLFVYRVSKKKCSCNETVEDIIKEIRKDIYLTAKNPMAAKKMFIKSDKYET